jgi:hypothetical protein
MVRWFKACLQWVLILSVVLLTGCLQYDLDLQFDSQTHGQWIQQVRWRGGGLPASSLEPWLTVLRDRTQAVGGKIETVSDNALVITVPFNNGQELVSTFNRFFNPPEADLPLTLPGGEPIQAHLDLRQGNWLLAIHNHLTVKIDLTSVPDLTHSGLPLLQGQQLLVGQVALHAPWVRSPTHTWTSEANWSLVPGQVNQWEADFWVPSPIGIGAIAIVLLVLLGYGLKYGLPRP